MEEKINEMFVQVAKLRLLMQSVSRFENCVQTLSHTVALYDAKITIIAKVLLALWHDRRQRSFNTTSWWRQPCKMIWDLRWHLSQCVSSVLMRSQTNWKQACMCIELYSDKHITQSSQIWINWPVSHKLMPETLRFPQSRGSRYCSTQSRICSPLRFLPQSVKLECSRFAPALQVSQYWPRTLNTAAEASSVRASQPRCTSHGSIPWSHSTDSHKADTCLLQRMIKQSDAPCLLQSTCCVCVNSLILLVCSSCPCSRDNVSIWVIWYSVTSRSTKFL